MNNDYWQGYNSNVSRPGDIEHQRGFYDRRDDDYRASVNDAKAPSWTWGTSGSSVGGSAVSGGGGLGTLVLLVVGVYLALQLLRFAVDLTFVALVLWASVGVGGVIVMTASRWLAPGTSVRYRHARRLTWVGLLCYVAITLSIRSTVVWLETSGPSSGGDIARTLERLGHIVVGSARTFSISNDLSMLATLPVGRWPTVLGVLLLTRLPGAAVFGRWLSTGGALGPRRGFLGVLVGSAVALVTVELSLSIAGWGCLALWRHSQIVPFLGDEPLSILVVYLGLLVLPVAIVGGLLGGAILRLVSRSSTYVSPYSWSYFTAVRALLAYGFLTVLAIFLFRDADALVGWLARAVLGTRPRDLAITISALGQACAALAAFQLPGIVAAGVVLFNRRVPSQKGVGAFARACTTGAVTCWLVCVPVWAVALIALPRLVAWADVRLVR